jgi:hypothetical protein
MTATRDRLLKEHDGNLSAALDHACEAVERLAARVSIGFIRGGPPGRDPKPIVPAIDVSSQDSPHG